MITPKDYFLDLFIKVAALTTGYLLVLVLIVRPTLPKLSLLQLYELVMLGGFFIILAIDKRKDAHK